MSLPTPEARGSPITEPDAADDPARRPRTSVNSGMPALDPGGNGRAAHRGLPRGRRSRWASRRDPAGRAQLAIFRLSDPIMVVGMLLLVFLATNIGRTPAGLADFLQLRITVKNLLLLLALAVVWRLLSEVTGIYRADVVRIRQLEAARVGLAAGLLSGVALVLPAISVTGAFQYSAVALFWICSSLGVLVTRNLVRAVTPRPEGRGVPDVLIVGTGPRGQRLYRELRSPEAAECNVVGFVDDDYPPPADVGVLAGTLRDLEPILMRNAVDEVLIALPIKSQYAQIHAAMVSCQRVGVKARFLADLFEIQNGISRVQDNRVSVVASPIAPDGWRWMAKRTLDLVGATLSLVLLSPVLLVAAVAIKATGPGPVLFTQDRYGFNRRLFKMYKLRTMVQGADALQAELEGRNEATGPVFKIRDDPRVTRVGRWLRRTSIDELPQLFNVLKGEMSLVGPRPLPVRDVHRFTEAALMRRFSIRPGCTCLWQISGRSALSFDDWIRLDLQYIDEWSLALDVRVLLRTVPAVVRGTGAA